MYDNVLEEFVDSYSKDLILACFGDEAELYAEDFKITESFYRKYSTTLLENIDIIRNKTIVDVGSSTGVWSVLMCMLGAKSVVSIEPRAKFSNGLKKFTNKHNFPITCVTDFHTATSDYIVDTVVMMQIADLIPDIVTFLAKLKSNTDKILLNTELHSHVPNDQIEVVLRPNVSLRHGFNFSELDTVDSVTGNQTDIFKAIEDPDNGLYLMYNYGANYFQTIARYLGYTVEKNYTTEYDEKTNSSIYVINLKS